MSFDRLAPYYRWMECALAAGKLQRCRTAFLPDIRTASRILLMGEGHGRFLERCCQRFPDAEITVVDASAEMLKVARKRCDGFGGKVQFVQSDCLDWQCGPGKFDLLATHFFLDCFRPDELAALIPKLANALDKNGIWLISDFHVPERGWRRVRARLIHGMMYAFFRRATGLAAERLSPPDDYLTNAGLTLVKRRYREWGLLHSDLWRKS